MKMIFVMLFTFSLPSFSQSIDPSSFGDTVGTLNQITPEADEYGTRAIDHQEQQDQQEQQYLEQKMRDKKNWERQKELSDQKDKVDKVEKVEKVEKLEK